MMKPLVVCVTMQEEDVRQLARAARSKQHLKHRGLEKEHA